MNDNKLQLKGFIVWALCTLFFLYEFFLRIVMGTYQAPIMLDLQLSSFEFSLLSTTIFLLVYGIMQIPAGVIIDHLGLKRSLSLGVFFCSLSSIGLSYCPNYQIALIFRFLMGFGSSFGFIGLLVALNDWMPHKRLAIFIGISQFIGTLGPIIATGPLEALAHSSTSWRDIFFSLGIVGGFLFLLVLFFVKNNHEKTGPYTIVYKPEKLSHSLKKLFSKKQAWFIAIVSASLYFTIEYLSENEGRVFLELKGIPTAHAASMLSLSWVAYGIGCALLGGLSDFLERRKIILNSCSLLALLSILLILYCSKKVYLQLAFFLLGISASGQCIGFATISEQFKKQFIAVGFAFNNLLITTVSAINAPLIGLLIDKMRTGNPASLESYLYAFNSLIFISLLATFISIFFIKETFCKSSVDFTILKKK